MRLRILSQSGISLVELMIAMVLGLMVSGALLAIFVNTNRNFRQDESIGRMQENARYAMRIMAQDLSMVGFWGPLFDYSGVNAAIRDCTTSPDSSNAAKCGGFFAGSKLSMDTADDCVPGTASVSQWAYDLATTVEVVKEATATLAQSTYTCLVEDDVIEPTDLLVIKRLEGAPLAADRADAGDNGNVFMRTNGDAGMLLEYDSSVAVAGGLEDWRYLIHLYYVQDHFVVDSDAIPTLYRMTLDGNGMELEDGGVAPGIEYFHVTFGIDGDNDGVPETYLSQPTSAQMQAAVTAKLYVLARSIDPDYSYTNDKTYQLGDVTKDFSGAPDNFYRRVFTTTVQLRNNVNRNRFNTSS